ncbi:MAG: TatD family hydrolase [Gemmatimonadota bacterium]|nr:TatD family hydrolase [Gemmatimonadota bacterium]
MSSSRRRLPGAPGTWFRPDAIAVLVDTHCHLAASDFAEDHQAVLERAWGAGVGHIVLIGESPEAAARALAIVGNDPRLSLALGLHPHEAASWTDETEAWLRAAAPDPRVVAIGETGLDYHYDHSPRPRQRQVFERQLSLAAELRLPAVIHAREADQDVAAVLRGHPDCRVVLHSFSSGPGLLEAALDLGHFVSFSGMVTFRNWGRDDMIRAVPPDRLLLETDAPYLAPVPHRGHRNEPAYVRLTAERIGAVLGIETGEVIRRTGANAALLFGSRLAA